MKTKRGLSDIVTNVLIILLVLVAVSIIWVFLRPVIQQGAGGLEGAGDCFSIQLDAVSCDAGTDTVVVKRGVGSGELSGVAIVITDDSSNSYVHRDSDVTLDELGSLSVDATDTRDIQTSDTVSVAALVQGSEGERTCSVSAAEIPCTTATP